MFGILLLTCVILYFINYYRNWSYYRSGEKFPGPKTLPLLGNSLNFATTSHGIFQQFQDYRKKYGRFYRVWNNGTLYVICHTHQDAEVLLSSTTQLRKSNSYLYLLPWIGEGLISASDIPYWRKHRKIITPTFHFKILYDFLDVFNKNAEILCEQLAPKSGKGPFDISHYIKLAALDNICETAMGVNVNAQRNSESSYVKAVKDITNVITLRFFKVWLMIDFLFNMSKHSHIQKRCLQILHGTTSQVIKERREHFRKRKEESITENTDEKKKLAFLDLLLESEEGSKLSDKELREEVDTFMFAGHDTISAGISLILYCLAQNPDIQENVYKELRGIFGDTDRQPNYADILEMKYLERVLKEAQRIYPSVPLIGRSLTEDVILPGNYLVPKNTQLTINIYELHRDTKIWGPEPEKFNPDNFLPEATQSRNPYAYIPFSAGPRNCIGQKYAMLAMKATVSTVLRKYKIVPSPYPTDRPLLASEIVLVSHNGFNVGIESRK